MLVYHSACMGDCQRRYNQTLFSFLKNKLTLLDRGRFLSNIRSAMIPICLRSLWLRKGAMYWAFRLAEVSHLAFLCRPWENTLLNFRSISVKLWKATNKLSFLSERWLHHFVSILAVTLTVVPPYSPRFLALVKKTQGHPTTFFC